MATPVIITITAVLAAVLTFVAVKTLDHLRRKDAESEAKQIIERAEQESRNRRREAELELKELAIQQKAEGEKELRKLRQELHERERSLDKRQDAFGKAIRPTSKAGKDRRGHPTQVDRTDPGHQSPPGRAHQTVGPATTNLARTEWIESRGSHRATVGRPRNRALCTKPAP